MTALWISTAYIKCGPGHDFLFLGLTYHQWGKDWTRSLLSYLQAPKPSKSCHPHFTWFSAQAAIFLERVRRLLLNGPWAPKPEASSIIFIVEGRINQLKEGSGAEQGSLRINDDHVRYARVQGGVALVLVNEQSPYKGGLWAQGASTGSLCLGWNNHLFVYLFSSPSQFQTLISLSSAKKEVRLLSSMEKHILCSLLINVHSDLTLWQAE